MQTRQLFVYSAPSSAPRGVIAYLYGTNTILVMWGPPERQNGIITEYHVHYTSTPTLPVAGDYYLTLVVSLFAFLCRFQSQIPALSAPPIFIFACYSAYE